MENNKDIWSLRKINEHIVCYACWHFDAILQL